jgi:hypothetical protein
MISARRPCLAEDHAADAGLAHQPAKRVSCSIMRSVSPGRGEGRPCAAAIPAVADFGLGLVSGGYQARSPEENATWIGEE